MRLILAYIWLAATPVFAADRPNVVWISADDLAPHALGCYGNALARTPHLDTFAQAATRFDRAYCNSPVCTASRQSFLTGRYPRSLGVTQLQTPLPAGTPTLATMLKAGGYDTAAIGKMHFNSNSKHGFDVRVDQPDYRAALKRRKPDAVDPSIAVQPSWKPFKDPAAVWLNAKAQPEGLTDANMAGTFFAESARDYLMAARDKPFFLMVSFYEPHSPFRFPVEDRARFDPARFPVPKVGPEDAEQIPAIFRELTDEQKQGITAAYTTSAAYLDRNVGRVLAALKASGQDRNTVVIITGDHGYLLGHHGRFEKHCGYEEAIRAPLLIRTPGMAHAGPQPALVEFIDIAPTILNLCDVAVPDSVQGRSLLPLLRGETANHRDAIFIEYSENEEAYVRTDRWKLIYSTGARARQDGYETGKPLPGRTVKLFDLTADPGEMTNVAAMNPAVVGELTTRLAEHLARTARRPLALLKGADIHEQLRQSLRPDDVAK